MTKETNTTTVPFRKELDPEIQRFLEIVDWFESEMMRLEVAIAALKIGYYAMTPGLKRS